MSAEWQANAQADERWRYGVECSRDLIQQTAANMRPVEGVPGMSASAVQRFQNAATILADMLTRVLDQPDGDDATVMREHVIEGKPWPNSPDANR